MADGTGVYQDDWGLCGIHGLKDKIQDVFLLGLVVLTLAQIKWDSEPCTLNLLLHHIGWQCDVHWSGLDPTLLECVVDESCGIIGGVELDEHAGDLLGHVGEDTEVSIAEGVVQKHAVALGDGGWSADDVNNWNLLGVGSGHTIECGKFTDTERCDDGRDALDTGIAISGICYRAR